MVAEHRGHGSQPHQVGLPLAPVAFLEEAAGNIRDLAAPEWVDALYGHSPIPFIGLFFHLSTARM